MSAEPRQSAADKQRGFFAIATWDSDRGRETNPIQVKAQVLRGLQGFGDPGASAASMIMPEDSAFDSAPDEPSARRDWRDADLQRALAAAQLAGLGAFRVEIAPDGTISIVVGQAGETVAGPIA